MEMTKSGAGATTGSSLPTVQLNDLIRRSDDSGWTATREIHARMGWSNLNRIAVITGDTLGRGSCMSSFLTKQLRSPKGHPKK
jgi:hypothetical protein